MPAHARLHRLFAPTAGRQDAAGASPERVPAAQERRGRAFDINLKEPSLLDYLPRITETADISDTFGKMQLMDRLIVDDGIAKVIDLGFHAFDEFFKMSEEIGFMKEAARRGVAPIVLFVADTDRASARAHETLRRQIPTIAGHGRQRARRARRTAARPWAAAADRAFRRCRCF